jgi:subfamily B ATP-binding cassette protein MsbA
MPDVWELVRPRKYLLAGGFVLMAFNRVAGLVLPASTKFLIDDIIGKRNADLLLPLIAAVVTATIVQALTSYALTQLLSKAAQRLIAELRQKIQAHVGRLPVSYYDANKTGTLVARIMNDVEGIRNLIGTGLVEFAGGLMTAVISLVVLLKISPILTGVALGFITVFVLALQREFKKIRPIFRKRSKINAEVTGRLTESLGGVRVIKGYHAESREAAVFSSGVHRLLDNILEAITAISLMAVSSNLLLGLVGAIVMYVGASQVLSGAMTLGGFVTFTAFLAFLVAPVFQVVQIGTQLTEAAAGLDRTREVLRERPEDTDPNRTVEFNVLSGDVSFENVHFAYETGKPVLHGVGFRSKPGTVTALVGSSGSGKSTIIGLIAAFHTPQEGVVRVDGVDIYTVRLSS